MNHHLVSSDVEKARVAKWLMQAQPVDLNPTWVEQRLAIEIGGHTYLVVNDQIFQCAHCGRYDPQWSVTGVLRFFEETFGIKPHEIEVTCTVAVVSNDCEGGDDNGEGTGNTKRDSSTTGTIGNT